jgi:hypothetical protein
MPASEALPTVPELLRAYHGAVGSVRREADANDGSLLDICGGAGALAWRRIAERDQDECRALYFRTAQDARLDRIIQQRFGRTRTESTAGTGEMLLSRPTTDAGAGMFWEGTRIAVARAQGERIRYWVVAEDTPVVGGAFSAAVPIRATVDGPDGAIEVDRETVHLLKIADPLWDSTWRVERLECEPGTLREGNDELRASIEQETLDARVGYETRIVTAMKAAGAAEVVLFRSDFLGDELDYGLNRIYVGSSSYETSDELLLACRLALPSVAVLGTATQVLAMTRARLELNVAIQLWTTPQRVNQEAIAADAKAAILNYFASRQNAFVWTVDSVRGSIFRAVRNVRQVTVTSSTPAPVIAELFDAYPLPRWQVDPWDIAISVSGS